MGKLFYASDIDIKKAARKADMLANRHGACYTPARQKDCKQDPNTGIWTCVAAAHNHRGSCDRNTVSRFGTPYREWGGSWSWEHDWGGNWNKSTADLSKIENHIESEESIFDSLKNNQETYEDALPGDYEEIEEGEVK
ncbi:hypothetical protein [Larkinella arboricola]